MSQEIKDKQCGIIDKENPLLKMLVLNTLKQQEGYTYDDNTVKFFVDLLVAEMDKLIKLYNSVPKRDEDKICKYLDKIRSITPSIIETVAKKSDDAEDGNVKYLISPARKMSNKICEYVINNNFGTIYSMCDLTPKETLALKTLLKELGASMVESNYTDLRCKSFNVKFMLE